MKKQAMKAELTSGTRGKFYRESTPGSRIKKGIKGVIKGVSKVVAPSTGIISKILTGGKSLPLEAARTGFKKPSSFKLRSGNKPSIAKLSGVVKTKQDNTRTPNVRTDIKIKPSKNKFPTEGTMMGGELSSDYNKGSYHKDQIAIRKETTSLRPNATKIRKAYKRTRAYEKRNKIGEFTFGN